MDHVDQDGKIEVKDVQDINGVRAFQFLNENTVIVSQENKQFRSHDFGPKEVYAQNLATYNLKTSLLLCCIQAMKFNMRRSFLQMANIFL